MTEDFLLNWLGAEESSALGECKGQQLDALIAKGLAEIVRPEAGDYARVRLTEAGRRKLTDG